MEKKVFNKKLTALSKSDKEFAAAVSQKIQDIEKLTSDIEKVSKDLEASQSDLAKLSTDYGIANDKIAELESGSDGSEEIAALKSTIEDLEAKISASPKGANNIVKGTFKSKEGKTEGKKFKFKPGYVKFNIKGNVIEAKDALKDSKLMESLVENSSIMFEEV